MSASPGATNGRNQGSWCRPWRNVIVVAGLVVSLAVFADTVPGLAAFERRDLERAARELRGAAPSLTQEQLDILLAAFKRDLPKLTSSSYRPLIDALAPALEAAPPRAISGMPPSSST